MLAARGDLEFIAALIILLTLFFLFPFHRFSLQSFTMAEKSCTIRTRKFMTNRLLSRRQFVSFMPHEFSLEHLEGIVSPEDTLRVGAVTNSFAISFVFADCGCVAPWPR